MKSDSTLVGIIKRTIRSLQSDDEPATVADLKAELRQECDDYDRAVKVYGRLRKHGEIYSYEQDDTEIVKITDDHL